MVLARNKYSLDAQRMHTSQATCKQFAKIIDQDCPAKGLRVAYIMSRFPKITETFILREMIEMQKLGTEVEVFPLQRENAKIVQPEAKPFVSRAQFTPLLSLAITGANLITMIRNPLRYLATIWILLRANWGSSRYFTAAFIFFPKSVYLASVMRRQGIQHIHAHFASHPAAAAWIIHRFSGIGYSFVAHGSDLHRDQHMLKEKVQDARFVAAISEYNRKMIAEVCGNQYRDKIHVVHCGIDSVLFARRSIPTSFDQASGPFRILCIGTLHEVKGQRFLIEACKILDDEKLDWQCAFIGDGSDRNMLENLARELGVHDRIVFHGACTSDTVRRELLLSDALVTPSVMSRDGRREGIPVVLMEAMASGVNCIASQISGIPELVEDGVTGFLTPQRDAKAIAKALLQLASDSDLRLRMSQAAVEKIMVSFTLRQNAMLLMELLDNAVSGKEIEHVT